MPVYLLQYHSTFTTHKLNTQNNSFNVKKNDF